MTRNAIRAHARTVLPWAVVAIVAVWAPMAGDVARAQAPPPPIHLQLVYQIDPSLAKSCPDAERFDSLVYVEMNYSPFTAPPVGGRLVVEITGTNGKVQATWRLIPPSSPIPSRSYQGTNVDCDEAVSDAVYALKLALPPRVGSTGSTSSTSSASVTGGTGGMGTTGGTGGTSSAGGSTSSGGDARPRLRAGASMAVALGVTPAAAAAGVSVDLGVDKRLSSSWLVSAAIEGRAIPGEGSDRASPSGAASHVTGRLMTAAVVPCAHYTHLGLLGCALWEIGAFTGASAGTAPTSGLYSAIGGRAGAEVHFFGPVSGRLTADLVGTLRPTRFCAVHTNGQACPDPQTLWSMSAVAGAVNAGIVGAF